jgi:pimeloyl-ACP methyl ester carboxylesterase
MITTVARSRLARGHAGTEWSTVLAAQPFAPAQDGDEPVNTKYLDINQDGYSVRCKLMCGTNARQHRRVVVCTHGFGGNKDITSIQKFAEKETGKFKDDAVLAFDWPCHGKDARKKLELAECFEYLKLVVDYARGELGASFVYNYSVSLGAFLTLAYMHQFGNPFARVALRSTGLDMERHMRNNVSPADLPKLERGREVEVGFERKMKIDQRLLDDLAANDVRKFEYFDWADGILMLHGTEDEYIPIAEARKFADNNVIELVEVEGSDHAFRNPKNMDLAIHTVVEFFSPQGK